MDDVFGLTLGAGGADHTRFSASLNGICGIDSVCLLGDFFMAALSQDFQKLCLAIGYISIQCALIESAMDMIVSTIYVDCGGNSLRKAMPKFIKDKTKFMIRAFEELPKLVTLRVQGKALTKRISDNTELRHDFIHSSITNSPPINGVYQFMRLDAKEHNHSMKIWKFDIKNFQEIPKVLEPLVMDSQDFAKMMEAKFHK